MGILVNYSHRYSGWPGAYCLSCGSEDPMEIALADNWYDPLTDTWDTEEHRMICKSRMICQEIVQPVAKARLINQITLRYRNRYTLGWLLKNIRIKRELTLRQFCLVNNIEPIVHSEIERNIRTLTTEELNIILQQLNVEKESADWREAHRLWKETTI